MLARVATFAIDGVDPRQVWVEVDIRSGLPAFTIVGLGDAAVRESRDRVRSAILNSGFEFPQTQDHREPRAGVPAQGRSRVRRGAGARRARRERAAAGRARWPPRGVRRAVARRRAARLTGALAVAEGARRAGLKRLIVPRERAREAALVEELAVAGVADAAGRGAGAHGRRATAAAAAGARRGRRAGRARSRGRPRARGSAARARDRRRRRPQPAARGRAGHRQDDARAAAPVDPAPDDPRRGDRGDADPQHRRAARGRPDRRRGRSGLRTTRSRSAGLVGGGAPPRPGEATLANHGVLFLDELSEFQRSSLEALAPAARGRLRDDRARPARAGVPDAVHARRRHQPMPVRVRRRRGPMQVRRRRPPPPQPAAQRAPARPHGPADQRRAAHRGRAARRASTPPRRGRASALPHARERQRFRLAGLRRAVQRRDGRTAGAPPRAARGGAPSTRWPRRTRSGR